MKKILLSSIAAVSFCNLFAQIAQYDSLDINNVKTAAQSNGSLSWTPPYNFAEFNAPADSATSTIFAGAFWVGGLDAGGGLHVAAQTYRQSGADFFQGPIQDSQHYTMQSNVIWNRVWKINKSSVDSLIQWQANPSAYPGYVVPVEIQTWPGNGDVLKGQAAQLAPFADANGDGVYDPNNGDYPCIKGDQCLYFIFNDDRDVHTETGGVKLGIEVHGMMYAYAVPGSPLDSAVFLNYRIFNRSSTTYFDTYFGEWTDFDIGDFQDDFIGSDVQRSLYFGYNGDSTDWAYGAHPPAQGVVFLDGPLADSNDGVDNDRDGIVDEPGETCTISQFVSYDNNFSVTGNPITAMDHYNYLQAYWKDSSPVTNGNNGYGGTTIYPMMFPGSSDPTGLLSNGVPQAPWTEYIAGNIPNDRRGVGSSGPFTLEAGSSECITFAYVFARGTGDHLSGVNAMLIATDSARAKFINDNPCTCGSSVTGVEDAEPATIGIYPNPATSSINIVCGSNATGSTIEIMDATGKLIHTSTVLSGNSAVVDISGFANGIYFVRVNKGSVVLTGKFIRN